MNVRLAQEQKVKILNSADIFNVMQQVLLRENKIRRNQEHFCSPTLKLRRAGVLQASTTRTKYSSSNS